MSEIKLEKLFPGDVGCFIHIILETEKQLLEPVWIPKLVRGLFSLHIYTVQHFNVGAFPSLRAAECIACKATATSSVGVVLNLF